jgi:hypothetical protein
MKRSAPLVVLLVVLSVLAVPLWAATNAASAPAGDRSPAAPYATAISTVTGIAISPLLGTGVYGAYQYFKTPAEQRGALPWYAQFTFWGPALLIVGACAVKDSFGAVLPPGWKKPLDVLETVENKATGLVAAGAVVPFTMNALSKMILGSGGAETVSTGSILPSGMAAIQVGAIDWSWLLNLLTVPLGIAVFALVWMASHAINALILISPWGAIDAVLKSGRTALLGLVTLTSTMNPWLSAGLSIVIVIVAYLVAGWSFRLMVFSSAFCWDFFTRRKRRFSPAPRENRMFSSNLLTKQGVPMRTYGRLINEAENGKWRFAFKPWLVLPERSVVVQPSAPFVGEGMFFSVIGDGEKTMFVLPPRYRGHERALVDVYKIEGGVQPAGLLKSWRLLKELFGGSAARTQVV